MAQTGVCVQTLHNAPAAAGSSGNRPLTIDRPEAVGGMGLGCGGGALVLPVLGACYTNDLCREAVTRGIHVLDVRVEIRGDWAGQPVRAQNVTYDVAVEADAPEVAIRELIEHTDRVAEIHISLRDGADVTLAVIGAMSSG